MNNIVSQSAYDYVECGWAVLPLWGISNGDCLCYRKAKGIECGKDSGKHPIYPGGCHAASVDRDTIRQWFVAHPHANLGIATGSRSNLLVIDIDPQHGGEVSLSQLQEQYGNLPPTRMVETGSGGGHYYFGYPSGIGSKAGLRPGIDYRGDGGYVVAPPSLHRSGNRYRWANDLPIANAPDWLVALLQEGKPKQPKGNLCFTFGEQLDFDADRGAEEGYRNARLCELAGAHLGRGESVESIIGKALAWARRCTPPADEGKVERTVRDLAMRQDTKAFVSSIPEGQAMTEAIVCGVGCPPDALPVLSPDAYHGIIGEILRAIEPETEAHPAGILLSFLTGFGNLIGRHAHYVAAGDCHYANLYCVLVGLTSAGKGQAWAVARRLLRAVDTQWHSDCVGNSGLSSGEGLIQRVRDAVFESEPVHGKPGAFTPVVVDAGAKDKRFLAIEREYGKTLTVGGREGNTLEGILKTLWEDGKAEVLTKKPMHATDAHVSVIAHITPDELRLILSQKRRTALVSDGSFNRCLWACQRTCKNEG